MQYNLISADGHIDLRFMPGDVFTSRAPAAWKDQVPQIVQTAEGPRWYAEGGDLMQQQFGNVANITPPKRGVSKHVDRMYEAGFYGDSPVLNEGSPHPTTPELRLKDLDMDHIDAEVMYGVLGMHRVIQNHELLTVVYKLYNDYAAEICKTNPQRLAALACIPNDDPQTAAAEVRRAASIGLRGSDFVVSHAVKPLWHRDWDPLWEAVQECDMPISFHTAGPSIRQPDDAAMAEEYNDEYRATLLTMFQICGAEFLPGVIFSGALERYPRMKFVLGECGAGWVPYVLSRMDEEYDDQFQHMSLTMKPSEYWYRQGHTTFQHEPNIARFVDMVGETTSCGVRIIRIPTASGPIRTRPSKKTWAAWMPTCGVKSRVITPGSFTASYNSMIKFFPLAILALLIFKALHFMHAIQQSRSDYRS